VRQRSTGSVVDTLGEDSATGSGSSRSSKATTSRRAAQNELGSTMVARSGRRHRSDRLRSHGDVAAWVGRRPSRRQTPKLMPVAGSRAGPPLAGQRSSCRPPKLRSHRAATD
jgi:hypothetical protein